LSQLQLQSCKLGELQGAVLRMPIQASW